MRSHTSSVVVPASPAGVWAVLTDPALTRSCVLGLAVESTFEVGSDIRFHGPGGSVLGGRILAHDLEAMLVHSVGDLSCDLVRLGIEEHDPTCWVTWTVEALDSASSQVGLTVDVFDDDDDAFVAWGDALKGLARVLTAATPPGDVAD